MKQVQVLRFEGGFRSDVNLEKVTDTIDQWAQDNSALLLNVALTSDHRAHTYPPALLAHVVYERQERRKRERRQREKRFARD